MGGSIEERWDWGGRKAGIGSRRGLGGDFNTERWDHAGERPVTIRAQTDRPGVVRIGAPSTRSAAYSTPSADDLPGLSALGRPAPPVARGDGGHRLECSRAPRDTPTF